MDSAVTSTTVNPLVLLLARWSTGWTVQQDREIAAIGRRQVISVTFCGPLLLSSLPSNEIGLWKSSFGLPCIHSLCIVLWSLGLFLSEHRTIFHFIPISNTYSFLMINFVHFFCFFFSLLISVRLMHCPICWTVHLARQRTFYQPGW